MYTRLVDFDTIGSDPMFFKYSYLREKRAGRGEDWDSNFTEWSLPSEDWREQPRVELPGKAEISSMITILQNGHGNAARELRVAGRNTEGINGYYHKMIFDKRWDFSPYPVILEKGRLLNKNFHQEQVLTKGDIHYYGKIRTDGKYIQNTTAELIDFNLLESPATLRIAENGNISEMKLHTVEAWTYLHRNDPGRDGTPKIFLGTLEMLTDKKSYGKTAKKLNKHNLKTFRFIVEATKEHVFIKPRSSIYGDMEFILTAKGVPIKNSMAARTYAMAQNGFDKMANADELKIASFNTLTKADIPLIRQKIAMNRKTKAQINSIITEMKKSSKQIRNSFILYTAFNTIVHATGLVLLDKPKIWTATRHFGAVLEGYEESYNYLYFTGKQSHEDAVRKINNRIRAYTAKIKQMEGKSTQSIFFSEHFSDYFYRLGLTDSELKFVLSDDMHAKCDVTPVKEGQSFFFIHLGKKADDELLTLQVKLPDLENEISRLKTGKKVSREYKAKIHLFENSGGKDAEKIYENIFTRHYSTHNNADEIDALLEVNKKGWQLYDVSGYPRNQIWVRHKN